jgi:uncharacterized protein YbbK (DUF523 family)
MEEAPVYLVSACLLGVPTAYDGGARLQAGLISLTAQGQVVPVCPEVAGGLRVPRLPAEIAGGDGDDVLEGRARVVTVVGADVTEAYRATARHHHGYSQATQPFVRQHPYL